MEEGFWRNTKLQETGLICLLAAPATSFKLTLQVYQLNFYRNWLSEPEHTCNCMLELHGPWVSVLEQIRFIFSLFFWSPAESKAPVTTLQC